MIVLIILTWVVAVFCLELGLRGNPAYKLLRSTPYPILRQAAELFDQEELAPASQGDEAVACFLRRFLRLSLLTTALFVGEMGLCACFLADQPSLWLCWFVIAKNLVIFIGGYFLYHRSHKRNPIEAILQFPPWGFRWERISYLLSAVCFFTLLLITLDIL